MERCPEYDSEVLASSQAILTDVEGENSTVSLSPVATVEMVPEFDAFETVVSHGNDEAVIGLELDVLDKRVCFSITVHETQARLSDLVPIARSLSNTLNELTEQKVRSTGHNIPCCKGCSVCCHDLALLSVPEALYLVEEMHRIVPDDTHRQIIRYSTQVIRLVQQQLRQRQQTWETTEMVNNRQQTNLADWYTDQRIACPFLHENSCCIYQHRPFTCRDMLIVGTDGPCKFGTKDEVLKVNQSIMMRHALKTLTGEFENTFAESVILPGIFEWYGQNIDRGERSWPAVKIVRRFVEILKSTQR